MELDKTILLRNKINRILDKDNPSNADYEKSDKLIDELKEELKKNPITVEISYKKQLNIDNDKLDFIIDTMIDNEWDFMEALNNELLYDDDLRGWLLDNCDIKITDKNENKVIVQE